MHRLRRYPGPGGASGEVLDRLASDDVIIRREAAREFAWAVYAALLLGRMEPSLRGAEEELRQALADEDPEVRRAAAETFSNNIR